MKLKSNILKSVVEIGFLYENWATNNGIACYYVSFLWITKSMFSDVQHKEGTSSREENDLRVSTCRPVNQTSLLSTEYLTTLPPMSITKGLCYYWGSLTTFHILDTISHRQSKINNLQLFHLLVFNFMFICQIHLKSSYKQLALQYERCSDIFQLILTKPISILVYTCI